MWCIVVAVVIIMLPLIGGVAAQAEEPSSFVGVRTCAGCHAAQFDAWKGSHHALAMQPAAAPTVLGDFTGAQLEHFGVTTTFFRDGGKFMVRTDGPDRALHESPIAYAFGVYPLQQYFIAMPGGRLQALGIAWNSRPKDQGGQRWFHLYPDQKIAGGRPAALDRTRPDLELPVRRLPLNWSEKELQPRRKHLRDQLDRRRRVLRGVPRPGFAPHRPRQFRREGQAGRWRGQDGPDQPAEADR